MWKLVVLAAALFGAPSVAAPGAAPHVIGDVGWLAGCWTSATARRTIDEQWMAPAGGTMFGMNRTVAGGRTVASEFLELREEGDDVFYIARPSGQAETRFRLTEAAPGRAVFENRAHDFPQVIRYTRNTDGSLLAQIEGPRGGQTRTIDFPMQRGVCP
jgi:hypothetical protein